MANSVIAAQLRSVLWTFNPSRSLVVGAKWLTTDFAITFWVGLREKAYCSRMFGDLHSKRRIESRFGVKNSLLDLMQFARWDPFCGNLCSGSTRRPFQGAKNRSYRGSGRPTRELAAVRP